MSTLPAPAHPSTGAASPIPFRNTSCCRCGAPCDTATCQQCLAGQAEFEARKLHADLRALVAGTGVYAVLPAVQRAGLLLGMGFTPESVAPFMDDSALIDTVGDPRSSESVVDACSAELLRRIGGMPPQDDSPSPAERAEIERPHDWAHIDAQEFSGRK